MIVRLPHQSLMRVFQKNGCPAESSFRKCEKIFGIVGGKSICANFSPIRNSTVHLGAAGDWSSSANSRPKQSQQLGCVVEIHPGFANVIKAATVKTFGGLVHRATTLPSKVIGEVPHYFDSRFGYSVMKCYGSKC